MRPPTPGTAPTGPTSRSSTARDGRTNPSRQIGHGSSGYPNGQPSRERGRSAATGAPTSRSPILIEMQMRHGMPPFQEALNHGILPSLSPDVDTNMTTDPFSLMRGAFCLQRALANDLAFPESNPGDLPIPQLVTSRQVIEMATIAGAAANRLLDKVGTLTPGKEADIVVLDARNINTWPMNNVPGTIVTMMNPRHVRDVADRGEGRVLAGQARRVGHRPAAAPDRAGARPGARADQRACEGRDASTGQQQLQQSVPAEFPGELLPQGGEHHGSGVCVEAVRARHVAPGDRVFRVRSARGVLKSICGDRVQRPRARRPVRGRQAHRRRRQRAHRSIRRFSSRAARS